MKGLKISLKDYRLALSGRSIIFLLGWQDIKQRYRRSKLGPFWLTISMGVMISTIGVVFGQVLNSPMQEYLPYIAVGLILWTFLSTAVMDGSTSFIESSNMIRQLGLPLTIYPARTIWRNVIILLHNMAILPLVYLVVGKSLSWNIIWIIPGFILFLFNVFWLVIFLGVVCTRFRDMPQIVNSLLQVFFYVTPVIWMPDSLSARAASMLMAPNPVYHLLQLVRAPLLGQCPSILNWSVGVGMAVFGFVFASVFFGKYKKRIAYWL